MGAGLAGRPPCLPQSEACVVPGLKLGDQGKFFEGKKTQEKSGEKRSTVLCLLVPSRAP